MNQYYFEALITNIKRENEDLLTSELFDLGASGVSEDLEFYQEQGSYNPITIKSDVFAMKAYFENAICLATLQTALAEFSGLQIKVLQLPNKDWLEEWKKGFEPFSLVDDIWVVPSWRDEGFEGNQKILIDPGMAFGTGTHDTTQTASSLLVNTKKKNPSLASLIDVGTGSGILAILAKMINFKQVDATEIDLDSRFVAKQNLIKNSCESVQVFDYQVEAVAGSYDVVLANIIDGILSKIQGDLTRLCKPGGFLIMTGVLYERKSVFLEQFDFSGFENLIWTQQGEWLGVVAQKKQ